MLIENADYVDLYDRMDRIPFERSSELFDKHLNGRVRYR